MEQPDAVREFVIASHFDLAKVKAMLADRPDLLTVVYDWGPGGLEDGLGAASHVGNRPIAEFFLAQGVPLTMCAAAMLGDLDAVNAFLAKDPTLANARGAHGITVMFHAAMSGNVAVANTLREQGCTEGYSHALHGAVSKGDQEMVAWLLDNGAKDVNMPDFEKKTPLTRAIGANQTAIADLLRQRGGHE